jgi:hypothetical protein
MACAPVALARPALNAVNLRALNRRMLDAAYRVAKRFNFKKAAMQRLHPQMVKCNAGVKPLVFECAHDCCALAFSAHASLRGLANRRPIDIGVSMKREALC